MKNYHTHTFRCQHATGDVIDYAKAAEAQGVTVLGMSDHVPLPSNRWPDVRMPMSQLDDYETAIATAQQRFPQLTILKAMECEYFPENHSFFEDELLGQRNYQYLIGSAHYVLIEDRWKSAFGHLKTPQTLSSYAQSVVTTMESGLFAFIAHPDLFGCSQLEWNDDIAACAKDILEAAESLKIPLEINANGFRKPPIPTQQGFRAPYPWLPFWEMATDYQIEVVCNSDAHHPHDLTSFLEKTHEIADSLGLKKADFTF